MEKASIQKDMMDIGVEHLTWTGVNFKIYASTATRQAALEVGDLDIMNLSGDAITADALKAKGIFTDQCRYSFYWLHSLL